MGLAPYGKQNFSKILEKLIDLKDDGSFKIDMSYFDYSLNKYVKWKILSTVR